MTQRPQQDWVAYEELTRRHEDQRLRNLSPQQRFVICEDLYRLIADGRRGGDWSRLSDWHWKQKTALRRRVVSAYRRLDYLHGERATTQDTD